MHVVATVRNVSTGPLSLTGGTTLPVGQEADVNPDTPHEAALIASGKLKVVNPDGPVPPTPPDPTFVVVDITEATDGEVVMRDSSSEFGWVTSDSVGSGDALIIRSDTRPDDPEVGLVRIGLPYVPPGGDFDPMDLAPSLWLRASDLALSDGAAVSTWPDASGNGNDAVGPGGGDPHYEATGINGGPSVQFDGFYTAVAGIVSDTPARTIFVVGRRTAGGGGNQRIWSFAETAGLFDNGGAWGYYATEATGVVDIGGDNTETAAVAVRYTSAASAHAFLNDGAAVAFNPSDSYQTDSLPFRLGRTPAGDYWYGQVADVFIVDSALSDEDVASMMAYYADTYGIAP